MLDLNELGNGRIPAITPALGAMLAEAGGFCLESQGHAPGVLLLVKGYSTNRYPLQWPAITAQAHRSWNDPEYATEHGAVGIAILLIRRETAYSVIESSRKGTGFDYWLGDEADMTFQQKARLEISGIRQGSDSQIASRVRQKLNQTDQSDSFRSGLPAYAIVVEFGRPVAEVREK